MTSRTNHGAGSRMWKRIRNLNRNFLGNDDGSDANQARTACRRRGASSSSSSWASRGFSSVTARDVGGNKDGRDGGLTWSETSALVAVSVFLAVVAAVLVVAGARETAAVGCFFASAAPAPGGRTDGEGDGDGGEAFGDVFERILRRSDAQPSPVRGGVGDRQVGDGLLRGVSSVRETSSERSSSTVSTTVPPEVDYEVDEVVSDGGDSGAKRLVPFDAASMLGSSSSDGERRSPPAPTSDGKPASFFRPFGIVSEVPAFVVQRSEQGDHFLLPGEVSGNCEFACTRNGTRWATPLAAMRSTTSPSSSESTTSPPLIPGPLPDDDHDGRRVRSGRQRHRQLHRRRLDDGGDGKPPPPLPSSSSVLSELFADGATGSAGSECSCRCSQAQPAFREDTEECVARLSECEMADFVDGERMQSLPVVILPMEGQLVHPTSRIALSDVQPDGNVVRAPVCAVTEASALEGANWISVQKFVVPTATISGGRENAGTAGTTVDGSRHRSSGGKLASNGSGGLPPRTASSSSPETPFRLYRDLDNTFLQWLGSSSLRRKLEGKLVRITLMCRDDAPDLSLSRGSIFRPCIGFRVSGSPHSPYFHLATLTTDPKTSSSSNLVDGGGLNDDGGLLGGGGGYGVEASAGGADGGISDYVIIGVCAGIVTLIYVVAVFVYVRVRHLRRLRRLQAQTSREKAAALAAQRQQEAFMRGRDGGGASSRSGRGNREQQQQQQGGNGGAPNGNGTAPSHLLAAKDHQLETKSGFLSSGVRSARLTQNTVQGLRQHLEEANAEAAKRAEMDSRVYGGGDDDFGASDSKIPSATTTLKRVNRSPTTAPPQQLVEKAPDALVTIETVELDFSDGGSDCDGGSSDVRDGGSDDDVGRPRDVGASNKRRRGSGSSRRRTSNGNAGGGGGSEPDYAEIHQNNRQNNKMRKVDCSSSESGTASDVVRNLSRRQNQATTDGKRPPNKLYFNPAFFEPENLAVPPPGAVEFLNRVREMMALAKNKLESKRYEPSLQEIPEEGNYDSTSAVTPAAPSLSSHATATTTSTTTTSASPSSAPASTAVTTMAAASFVRADMRGTFGNPGFTLEASAAEIRSFIKFSGGLLRRPEATSSPPAQSPSPTGNGDKVHRWLEGVCNQVAGTALLNEDYPNSYDSGVSTGDGAPDSLSTTSDTLKTGSPTVFTFCSASAALLASKKMENRTPERAANNPTVMAAQTATNNKPPAPGVRPPRKRNPKYETTPSRKNLVKENADLDFSARRAHTPDVDAYVKFREGHVQTQLHQAQSVHQNRHHHHHGHHLNEKQQKAPNQMTSSVDRLNEILYEAESKMPKIKGGLPEDENKMKIRVQTVYPENSAIRPSSSDDNIATSSNPGNNFENFLPVDEEITESNPVLRLEMSRKISAKGRGEEELKKKTAKHKDTDSDHSSTAQEESNGVSEIYINNTFESDLSQPSTLTRSAKFQRSNSIGAVPVKEILSPTTGTCKLMIEVTETYSDSEPETTSAREPGASPTKRASSRVRRKISRKESFLDSLERPKNGKLSRKPSIVQDSLERPVVKRRQQQQQQQLTHPEAYNPESSAPEGRNYKFSSTLSPISNGNEYSDTDSLCSSTGRHYRTFGDFKSKESSETESDYTPIEIRSVPPKASTAESKVPNPMATRELPSIPLSRSATWRENSFLLPNYWQKSFKGRIANRRSDDSLLVSNGFAPDSLMFTEGGQLTENEYEDGSSTISGGSTSPDSVLSPANPARQMGPTSRADGNHFPNSNGRRHSAIGILPSIPMSSVTHEQAQNASPCLRKSSSVTSLNSQRSDMQRRFENISRDLLVDRNANGLSQGMLIALNLRSKLAEKYGKDFEKKYFDGNSAGDTFRNRLKKLVRTESCDSILKDGTVSIKKYKSVDEVLAQLKQCSNMCAADPLSTTPLHLAMQNGQNQGTDSSKTSGLDSGQQPPSAGIKMLLKMLEDQQNGNQQLKSRNSGSAAGSHLNHDSFHAHSNKKSRVTSGKLNGGSFVNR